MDCSDRPRRSATKNRHIPAGIVEEILWKLPVKSLLRFSSVSRSWNLMINEARFSKKYRGRERMLINNTYNGSFKSCPLSAAVSNNPIGEASTDLDVVKFDQYTNALTIRAVCDGLCCLENKRYKSLFIWNPSNGKFHELPQYPLPTTRRRTIEELLSNVHYGLGYDSVGDDYKLLRICNYEAALYSLTSNSWREIQSFPRMTWWRSWFVSGAFHWLCFSMSEYYVIVSFDLSKEEYGELALPTPMNEKDEVEVVELRGKLCLSINYWMDSRFVLWVMEDYGATESWTKKFDINYALFGSEYRYPWLIPLCAWDDVDDDVDGQDAICLTSISGESWAVLKNKDGKTLVKKSFGKETIYRVCGFVYVESLVSPAGLVRS